jgi:hypothetical protein
MYIDFLILFNLLNFFFLWGKFDLLRINRSAT